MKKLSVLNCQFCSKPHTRQILQQGWVTIEPSLNGNRARRVICPDCLLRMGIKPPRWSRKQPEKVPK